MISTRHSQIRSTIITTNTPFSDWANRARNGPVTIARNNEHFALIRRDQAEGLIQAVAQFKEVVELFEGATPVRAGLKPPASMTWVAGLNKEDQVAMIGEVLTECARASAENDWNAVGDLLHQWKESAAAMDSGVLRSALAESCLMQDEPGAGRALSASRMSVSA